MLDPIALAQRYIAVPSVTGDEAAMAREAAATLGDLGFDVQLQPVAPGRANVVATLDPPRVVLCTHLDTVPPYLPPKEDAEWIYGRGACDTKGLMAAMFAACERLIGDGIRDVGVVLVVGEETDSLGAKHANATLQWPSVRATIVGEPTESAYALAQKGGFKFTVRSRGVAAHSGYPERGRSALLPLLDALAAIRAADWGHDATLGPGTVNLGVVRAGLRANIVPDQAEAELFVRVVDSAAAVRARIESLLAGRPLEWSEDTSNDPQFLHAVPGERTTVVAFNTDVPHLTHFGKMHLVGPGSILDAHAPGERIAKRELLDAVDLYRRAVVHLRAS